MCFSPSDRTRSRDTLTHTLTSLTHTRYTITGTNRQRIHDTRRASLSLSPLVCGVRRPVRPPLCCLSFQCPRRRLRFSDQKRCAAYMWPQHELSRAKARKMLEWPVCPLVPARRRMLHPGLLHHLCDPHTTRAQPRARTAAHARALDLAPATGLRPCPTVDGPVTERTHAHARASPAAVPPYYHHTTRPEPPHPLPTRHSLIDDDERA